MIPAPVAGPETPSAPSTAPRIAAPAKAKAAAFSAGIDGRSALDALTDTLAALAKAPDSPGADVANAADAEAVEPLMRVMAAVVTVGDSYPRACDLLVSQPGFWKHLQAIAGRVLASGTVTVRPSMLCNVV